jgi:hypothetical protein
VTEVKPDLELGAAELSFKKGFALEPVGAGVGPKAAR